MTKQISQAEARRLKKRIKAYEERDRVRYNRYRSDFPGGVHARTFTMGEPSLAALDMAVKLDCVLVAKIRGQKLEIYAVPEGQ